MEAVYSSVKRFIPKAVKVRVRKIQRDLALGRAVREIDSLQAGQMPSRDTLKRLEEAWSNTGWSADIDYLEETARTALESDGPILECGSGLTTLLIGLLAKKRDIALWSLEHHGEWYQRVKKVLDDYRLDNVSLCLLPLKDYGEYTWYSLPDSNHPEDFRLVICDGPPADTPGGRYGFMPVMKPYLARDCVILCDDAEREDETKIINKWNAEVGLDIVFGGSQGRYARLTFATAQDGS